MNKEQKQALVEAWGLHGKIIGDIESLARVNVSIAYGCIRTAETILDMMMVDRLRREQDKVVKEAT